MSAREIHDQLNQDHALIAQALERGREKLLRAADMLAVAEAEVPIRQKSAAGQPKPHTSITRTCRTCGACFIGLAAGKTGERGIWDDDWKWYCSAECAET